jgi:hypothetical protein
MKWIMENTYLIICTNSNKIDHFYTLRLFVMGDLSSLFIYLQLIYSQPTLVYVCWKFACNVNSRVIWNTLTDINNWYRTMYPNIFMAYFQWGKLSPWSGKDHSGNMYVQLKSRCAVTLRKSGPPRIAWEENGIKYKQNISIKYFMIGWRTKSFKKFINTERTWTNAGTLNFKHHTTHHHTGKTSRGTSKQVASHGHMIFSIAWWSLTWCFPNSTSISFGDELTLVGLQKFRQ